MSIYTIVLFLHVSGAIGYFVGMGTWLFVLAALRRAQRVEQVRALTNLAGRLGPLFGIVFLMTNKPSLIVSLIVMGVALALGLASGALVSRATRTREKHVATPVDRMREPVR